MSRFTTRMNRRSAMTGAAAFSAAFALSSPMRGVAQQGHSPMQATPATDDQPLPTDDYGLITLLSMIPQARLAAERGMPFWAYVDMQRQFSSLGLHFDQDGPDFDNEPASVATLALSPWSPVFSFSRVEDLIAGIGFQPLGMNQNLSFGQAPDVIALFRGEFDPDALLAAWKGAGYEPVETTSGIPAWTIGPEGEFSIQHPVQQYVIASMNNVAIVNDVLIYSATLATLNEVLDHIDAGTASVMDDEVQGPVIRTLPQTTVSALGFAPLTSATLQNVNPEVAETLEETLDESLAAVGPMPEMTCLVAAVNEGAVPLDFDWQGRTVENAGEMYVRLGMETAEDAEQALKVIEYRFGAMSSWITNVPFSDLLSLDALSVEGTTAQVTFTQLESPRIWSSMFVNQDLPLFLPGSPSE